MLAQFLNDQGVDSHIASRMLDGDLKETPTEYLCGKTPRYAMQTLGTEWRNMLGRDLWLNAWERNVREIWERTDYNIIVDDMRFLHEAERVRAMGGKIIRIHRAEEIVDHPTHQSEIEWKLIHPDYIIINNGPPERMLVLFLDLEIVPDA